MDKLLTTLFALQAHFFGENEERGATAVEYGLLVALIAAVIVVIVGTLGTDVKAAFTTVTTNI